MDGVEVVRYSPKHLPGVVELWRERFPADSLSARTALFRWLTEENPLLDLGGPYYLLLHHDRVIGMHGHMPVIFSVKGRRHSGFMGHDDMISAEYRGRGLGKVMLRGVAEQATRPAVALWFNEPNYHLYRKSGWQPVAGCYEYVRVLDPEPFLRGRIARTPLREAASLAGRMTIAVRNLPSLLQGRSDGVSMERIDRFDRRFDDLFDRSAPGLGIAVVRDQRYLNWRFVDKPFNRYDRRAAVDRGGRVLGYAVTKEERAGDASRVKIVDLLADPAEPGASASMILQIVESARARGAASVSVVASEPRLRRLLTRLGFWRARKPQRVMVHQWEGVGVDPVNSVPWFLSHGDADGDAWTVDPGAAAVAEQR